MRRRGLRAFRVLLMVLALVFAFGGGFAQFYLANHLPTDVICGYLIGFGFACLAIGMLLRNALKKDFHQISPEPEKIRLKNSRTG